MAATATRKPVDQSMIDRIVNGARSMFGMSTQTSTDPQTEWFGPDVPLAPVAPPSVAGRQLDFPVGYNLQLRPRPYEQIGFEQLRGLADNYDLVRILIETRKDQICNMKWKVGPKDDKKQPDRTCDLITEFLQSPDRDHDWQAWLRMVLEDMLVIDAATIYPRFTLGGDLYSLEPVDGATIKRVIDDTGRTPMPPDPAYQQVLKGLPAVNYTRDELIYAIRNPRTSRLYGMSPVEQLVVTVNIALRRQIHKLQFYTEGTMPEALIGVPETWNPDQIKQFQFYFDALLTGDTAARRKARFIPNGMNIFETKAGALKDEYDDWLARVCCFCFSIEPTPFVKQTNKATSDTAREQSLAEGLVPISNWVRSIMNRVIATHFKRPDLCFDWVVDQAIDPFVQAQIDAIYLAADVITPTEVRNDSLGKEPMTPEQLDEIAPPPPPPMQGDVDPITGKPLPDTEPTPDPGKPAPGKPKPGTDPKAAVLKAAVDDAVRKVLEHEAKKKRGY